MTGSVPDKVPKFEEIHIAKLFSGYKYATPISCHFCGFNAVTLFCVILYFNASVSILSIGTLLALTSEYNSLDFRFKYPYIYIVVLC